MVAAPSFCRSSIVTLAAMLALCACSGASPGRENVPAAPEAPPATSPAETSPAPEPVMREGFVVGDPAAEGIDGSALGKLAVKAKAQRRRRSSS